MHAEADLGPNFQAREANEHVQGVGDPAVGRVLERDQAELNVAAVDFLEDRRDRAHGDMLDRFAELGDGCQMAIAVLGAEVGDPQGALQGAAPTHHFAKDEAEGLLRQWALTRGQGARDDFLLARGRPDFQPLFLLYLADLKRNFGASIEQGDQFLIDPVDFAPEAWQGRCALRIVIGRRGLGSAG